MQNAQAIWKELSNDAERSTVAQLNATNLLQYTHTAQVENWKGTMLSFILHYQEQIRLYDQLQPPNEQTSDHAKLIYLQNAVYAIEELRSVQTTGSQLALANGTVPTYKDYEALLKSVASTYDQARAPAKRQPTRSAKRTDIWDANITESFHEAYEFGFDIDTPTDIVQAHMRDQLGVIPKETFGRLSPESRKAWSHDEAMQFDLKNRNTLWREATDLEMLQLLEYDTFRDLGHKDTASPWTGYKKICTHLVYDC
jgi:hypothetical protein